MQNIDRIELLAAVFRAGAIIVGKFSGQGLDFAQFAALYALDRAGGRLPKIELLKILGLDSFIADRTMNSLVKIKAIKKDGLTIAMTDSGRQMFSGAVKLMKMRTEGLVPKEREGQLKGTIAFLDDLQG